MKNAISQLQSLRLYSGHVTRESNVGRSYDIQVRREKALGGRPLSYSSRGTLMTHTDRSSSAALKSNTSKQSSEEASCWHAAMLPSLQFGAGCFHVRWVFHNMRN